MRRILASIFTLPLLLCACGGAQTSVADIQAQYAALATAQMEAEVVCHLDGESRAYTLACTWGRGGASTAVIAPEALRGVTAAVTPDGLTVTYDGAVLPAGELSDVCPANCLPYLLRALADGYLLEQSAEPFEGVGCTRLALDTTAGSGEKVLCSVWVETETLLPRYAEFSQDGNVVLTVRMRTFSCTVDPAEE